MHVQNGISVLLLQQKTGLLASWYRWARVGDWWEASIWALTGPSRPGNLPKTRKIERKPRNSQQPSVPYVRKQDIEEILNKTANIPRGCVAMAGRMSAKPFGHLLVVLP